jgi:hypothetical protein
MNMYRLVTFVGVKKESPPLNKQYRRHASTPSNVRHALFLVHKKHALIYSTVTLVIKDEE